MAKEYLEKLSAFMDSITPACLDDVDLQCRHFFSGAALYANGRICITLTPVGLALKLPGKTKERLLRDQTAVALRYFPKGPIKKDYVLFPNGMEDGEKILSIIEESIVYVITLSAPERTRKAGRAAQ